MHYRSPEAVLQAGYSYALDVWAAGCITAELATGRKLFALVHADVHLALMEACLGPIPLDLIARGRANPNQQNPHLFASQPDGAPRLAAPRRDRASLAALAAARPLGQLIGDPALRSLLEGMLAHDPGQRLTAADCLRHEFYEVSDGDGESDSDDLLRDLGDSVAGWARLPSVVSWFAPIHRGA